MTPGPGATARLAALEIIPPRRPLVGRVTPPGSKSITNRALLLAALARGRSTLTGAVRSDDTIRMSEALAALGVRVEDVDASTCVVTNEAGWRKPDAPLFLGNAGTATRFLTAAVATVNGEVVIDGDEHMRKRPIGALVEALRRMGVSAEAPTGCPPVTVHGRGSVPAGRVEIDASLSSQYVSALLMLAACGSGPVEVAVMGNDFGSRGYVDLTLAAMRRFGAQIEQIDNAVWRVAPTGYVSTDMLIEPDASAATYFWAAEALTGGAIDLGVAARDFTQPDARSWDVMRLFPHLPPVIDGAQMQDAVPTLAVLAAFNATPVRFTGIANLRVKECDRVRALATELSRIRPGLGEEIGDDLLVRADPGLAQERRPTHIQTYSDHRIAMSFALAGLMIEGITILDPRCVNKTFPAYWDALASLGVELRASV